MWASECAPSVEIAGGHADEHGNAQAHGFGNRITQPATIGFNLAELVDDQQALWLFTLQTGFDRFRHIRQDSNVKAAAPCVPAALLGDRSDLAAGEVQQQHVAGMSAVLDDRFNL